MSESYREGMDFDPDIGESLSRQSSNTSAGSIHDRDDDDDIDRIRQRPRTPVAVNTERAAHEPKQIRGFNLLDNEVDDDSGNVYYKDLLDGKKYILMKDGERQYLMNETYAEKFDLYEGENELIPSKPVFARVQPAAAALTPMARPRPNPPGGLTYVNITTKGNHIYKDENNFEWKAIFIDPIHHTTLIYVRRDGEPTIYNSSMFDLNGNVVEKTDSVHNLSTPEKLRDLTEDVANVQTNFDAKCQSLCDHMQSTLFSQEMRDYDALEKMPDYDRLKISRIEEAEREVDRAAQDLMDKEKKYGIKSDQFISASSEYETAVGKLDLLQRSIANNDTRHFIEFYVESRLLFDELNSRNDMCFQREDTSAFADKYSQLGLKKFHPQFGIYGELSIASLIEKALDVTYCSMNAFMKYTNETNKKLMNRFKQMNIKKIFDELYDTIKSKGTLTRGEITECNPIVEQINNFFFFIVENLKDTTIATDIVQLMIASRKLIINIMTTKSTLDGEQGTPLQYLNQFRHDSISFLFFATADQSAALSSPDWQPTLTEFTGGGDRNKYQLIFDNKVLHSILVIKKLNDFESSPPHEKEIMEQLKVICEGISISNIHTGLISFDDFNMVMNQGIQYHGEITTVYDLLSNDRIMEPYMKIPITRLSRDIYYLSRLLFNYNLQDPKLVKKGANLDSKDIFGHDYHESIVRDIIGTPNFLDSMICEFIEKQFGDDLYHLVSDSDFASKIMRYLEDRGANTTIFNEHFITWFCSDSFVWRFLLPDRQAAIIKKIQSPSSIPVTDIHETTKIPSEKKYQFQSENNAELSKYTPFDNSICRLFDEVYSIIKSTPAHKVEEIQLENQNRCFIFQPNDKKRTLLSVARLQHGFRSDPRTYFEESIFSHIDPKIDLPDYAAGTLDLFLKHGSTNTGTYKFLLLSAFTKIDAAKAPVEEAVWKIYSSRGGPLRYRGQTCAYVHSLRPKIQHVGEKYNPKNLGVSIREKLRTHPQSMNKKNICRILKVFIEDQELKILVSSDIKKIPEKFKQIVEKEYDQLIQSLRYYLIEKCGTRNIHINDKSGTPIQTLWDQCSEYFTRFFFNCNQLVEIYITDLIPLHNIYRYIDLVLMDGKITNIFYEIQKRQPRTVCGGDLFSAGGGAPASSMDLDEFQGGKKKYKGGGDPIGYYLSTETEKENEGFVLKPIYDQATLDRMKQRFHENMLINIYHQKIEEEMKRNRVTVRPNPITPDIVKKVPSITSPIIIRTPTRRNQQSLPLRTAGGFAKKQTKRNQKNKRTKKYRNKNPRRKTRRS
jgi:hypothetical protein